jgi:hypothetical protein
MPKEKHPPSCLEPRHPEERDPLGDWLRQIDRWVNEGGAEERPRSPAKQAQRSLQS